MSTHFEIFPGKDLSGLFKDIYDNQQNKKRRISELISDMRKIIRHAGDMVAIGPIIKDLVDSSVKNDDALLKLAAIVQRIIASDQKTPEDIGFLTEKEKSQLIQEFESSIKQSADEQGKIVDNLAEDVEELKQNLNK